MTDTKVGGIQVTELPPPLWRPLADGRMVEIAEEYRFAFIRDGVEIHARINAGEVIDGASIPRAVWAIVGSPFVGFHRLAAVPHDMGYCGWDGRVYDIATGERITMSRLEWDQLFYSAILFATANYDAIVEQVKVWKDSGWVDKHIVEQLAGRGICCSDAEAKEALHWKARGFISRIEDRRHAWEMYQAVRCAGWVAYHDGKG